MAQDDVGDAVTGKGDETPGADRHGGYIDVGRLGKVENSRKDGLVAQELASELVLESRPYEPGRVDVAEWRGDEVVETP